MRSGLVLVISIFLGLGLVACGDKGNEGESTSGQGYEVFVSNYPLGYMVTELTSGKITPEMPWASKGDPAYWKPDQEAITSIQEGKLLLFNGLDYETWAGSLSLPKSKIVDTSTAFQSSYIEVEGVVHSHGPEGEHSHSHKAFTSWLDMNLAREHLKAVHQALIDFKISSKEDLQEKYQGLDSKFADMDSELKRIGKSLEGHALFGSHPVYQYLAKAYGLEIIELHLEPGDYPNEKQWDEIKKISGEKDVKTILWEGEPLEKTKEKLTSLGITSLVYSPCGDMPSEGDFQSVMESNIRNLASISQ